MAKLYRLISVKNWEDYLEFFILRKKAEGSAAGTIKGYVQVVSQFFSSYPHALESYDTIRHSTLQYFARKTAKATHNIRRAYLKAFFDYLEREGVIEKNPIDFPRMKDEGRARNVPPEVLKMLLDAPNRKTYAGLRDYTMILFILDTGVRPGEALQLLPEDFNLNSHEVTIRAEIAKTRKKRTLPLSPLTASSIRLLMRARPREWWDNTPLFCSEGGKPMLESSLTHRFKKYSAKIGYKVTPYDLRHSFALLYLRNGGNIFALQRTMGHADLNMTKRYLALTQEDLRAEHQKSSPINQLVEKRVRRV